MLYRLLNLENPDFDRLHLEKLQAFYRGSRSVRQMMEHFIKKNQHEDGKRYEQRKEQAPYLNYTGPIIDKFAAMLLASPPNAEVSKDTGEQEQPEEDWLEWCSNVDGNGSDLTQFMREQFTDALMKKRAIWTLKLPSDEGVPAANLAEWRERNLGQVQLEELETQDCIDWHCDSKGQLIWLIHRTREEPRESPKDARDVIVETWRIFDREAVTTYQVRYKSSTPPKGDDDIKQLGEAWEHGLGECPVIILEMPDGLWVADRIYEAQLEHFRISAALSWAFKAACYAMALWFIVDRSTPPVMGEGLGIMLDADDKVDWLSPPTSHLTVMQGEKSALKDEIYRIIHQMADSAANNAGTIGRSGKSKSADLFSTRTILESFAQLVRSAVERTYKMAARIRDTDTDTKWVITGLDQFDDLNLAELIESITGIDAVGMPSPVYQKEVRRMLLDSILPNLDESTRARVMDQIEAGMQKLQDQKDAEADQRIELQKTMVEGAHVANQLNGAIPSATPGKPGATPPGATAKGPSTADAGRGRAPSFGRKGPSTKQG